MARVHEMGNTLLFLENTVSKGGFADQMPMSAICDSSPKNYDGGNL